MVPKPEHHYCFVTGKLAEPALRAIVESLASKHQFEFTICVMPITVAALMTPRWLRRHLSLPPKVTHVIIPGFCDEGVAELSEALPVPLLIGPKDCRELPEMFGGERMTDDFGDFDIEIIAEINHAPRRTINDVVSEGLRLQKQGADIIDFGCDPASRCENVADYIAALCEAGLKVSVDTFDPQEAQNATKHGASLVLSVNSTNREQSVDWGCEVVVIPDSPGDEMSFEETIDFLDKRGVPHRLDPILEPVGTGFMESLVRYSSTRKRYPQKPMMMGIGNVTELTDVDSAGVNMLLMGICQELGIQCVLTTQVINWAKSSVQECDHARRLAHYAVKHGIPPKRISDELVMLRDPKLRAFPDSAMESLANTLKDNNYRLYAQHGQIHLISSGLHLTDDDPFRLFERLMAEAVSDNVDPGHGFYLGFEMAKAAIANQLGKQYEQDQGLRWGFLTEEEDHHRIQRTSRHRNRGTES